MYNKDLLNWAGRASAVIWALCVEVDAEENSLIRCKPTSKVTFNDGGFHGVALAEYLNT